MEGMKHSSKEEKERRGDLMKIIIITLFLIFSFKQLLSQSNEVIKLFEGKVEYISSQFIYVQFENTDGLTIGDTLFTKKKGKYSPKLIIESLSSRSCATKPLRDKVAKGAQIFGFVEIEKEKVQKLIQEKVFVENNNSSRLIKADTSEFIGFKEMDRGLYGRFSISSYSNLSNISNRVDYQNWRYSLSLNADNIKDSKFSFSNYITFRYRADEWNYVSSNLDDALRIYDLSVKYDFNQNTNILLGRKINRKVANIGAVDGIQLETKYKKFTIGGILGSRPDYKNYGYNLDFLQFGGYVDRIDSIGKGTMQNTIAVMQQMNDASTDRRFLYFQHNNNIFDKTSLFLSSELDLFEKINGEAKNDIRFTSLFLSLRYSPKRWISTSLSYDARKNVIYYETFKNYADQLIESALRQGFRFRVNLRPIKYVFANAYMGYRFRDDDIKPTRNFGGSITHSRVPYLNLSLNFSILHLSTNYLDGNVFGTRISKDLFDGLVYGTLGYKKVDYTFLNTDSEILQDIVQLDLSFRIVKNMTLSLNFEGTYEDKLNYSNIYMNFTTRF